MANSTDLFQFTVRYKKLLEETQPEREPLALWVSFACSVLLLIADTLVEIKREVEKQRLGKE